MSVEIPKVIDFTSIDKNGYFVLTISDHLEWDEENEHLLILQEKINAYLSFIENHDFYDNCPQALNRKILINIVAKYPPNKQGEDFLGRVEEIIKSAGYDFSFAVAKSEN